MIHLRVREEQSGVHLKGDDQTRRAHTWARGTQDVAFENRVTWRNKKKKNQLNKICGSYIIS